MTTATEETSATTLADVEEMRQRRADLEERHDEYAEREEALSSELAHLTADGEEGSERAEEVRDERRQVRETRSDLESALEVMDTRIEEATLEAARSEAGVEIASLRKRVGGISGQHTQDVERARELASKLVETVRRVETARDRQRHLLSVAEALADRFGLEVGEFKVLPEGSSDLSGLRTRTAKRLEDGFTTGPDPADGVDELSPGEKVAHAARALRSSFGEEEVYGAEILEMVGEELSAQANRVRQAVQRHEKDEKERKALEAAMEFLDSAVHKPIHASELLAAFRGQELPPTDQKPETLMVEAARELGLVRVKDAPTPGRGHHFFAPAGFEPDGSSWWPASVGE